MNPSIAALLDLQAIDRRRLALRKARGDRAGRVEAAQAAVAAAEQAAAALAEELGKVEALRRQYTADLARCDAAIADARAKQATAKTNKEYMAIINGIEQAKSEKSLREQSLKDLGVRLDGLGGRIAAAAAKVEAAKAELAAAETAAGGADASPEEVAAQAEYDARKQDVDPAFLEQYERLAKANHRQPLMPVDPKTRSTPVGSVVSHNVCEQIRMGKLVIDRMTNAILYIRD